MNTNTQNTVTINNEEFAVTYNPLNWQVRGMRFNITVSHRKAPTTDCVKYNGRLRRIYSWVSSNIGGCFIVVNGKEIDVSYN